MGKLTTQLFANKKKQLMKKKDAFSNKIDKEYTALALEYIKDNSPVQKHTVYKIIDHGQRRPRFKFTRFIPYQINVEWFDEHCMLRAWGWWLDENNVPTKWEGCTVTGVGNPSVFEISENQTALPHPDSPVPHALRDEGEIEK